MANRSTKKAVGVRLTEDALNLLRAMAERSGLSQAGVLELAIREKAEKDGVKAKVSK